MWSHSPDDSEADHCPSCGDKQEKSRIWSNLIETSGGARVWEWHVLWLVQPNYRYKTNQHAPGLLSTVNWHQFVVVENCGLASPHYPSLTNISNQWWRLSHLLSKYWLDIKIEMENCTESLGWYHVQTCDLVKLSVEGSLVFRPGSLSPSL